MCYNLKAYADSFSGAYEGHVAIYTKIKSEFKHQISCNVYVGPKTGENIYHVTASRIDKPAILLGTVNFVREGFNVCCYFYVLCSCLYRNLVTYKNQKDRCYLVTNLFMGSLLIDIKSCLHEMRL